MKTNNRWLRLNCLMLILIVSLAMLAGCGGSNDTDDGATADAAASETQDAGSGGEGDWNNIDEQPEIDISTLGGPGGVEVDLSKLSSTMVYAVVNDMMMKPNAYLGRKIRMNGSMSVYHDEETGSTYYACLIRDATACCAQGIEFITTDEFSPEDYPADGEDVTVVGKYDLYEEDGYQYGVLKDAVLE